MSGRPRTACRRCKSHKLRCSGVRPVCPRCQRANRPCIYDPTSTVYLPADSSLRASHEPLPPVSDVSIISTTCHALPTYGIPVKLMYELVSIYFSHVYNATLLLHRSTFLQQLAANEVRPHIILSICAFASKFYCDSSGSCVLREQGFSFEWAAQAGSLVFAQVDDPHEENIVTFINLALFWYSEGEWRRSAVYQSNGVLIARLLKRPDPRQELPETLQLETQRRRLWACFLIKSFCSECQPEWDSFEVGRQPRLPCTEENYTGITGNSNLPTTNDFRNASEFGELVNIMTLWNRVSLLIRNPSSNFSSRLAAIHLLDRDISEWYSKLPLSLQLGDENLSRRPQAILPLVFLIHSVYHQCFCSLHSSIVPIFSWSTKVGQSSSARQISAQIAFEHASSTSILAERILKGSYEISRTPSFLGYACYCACAILIPFLRCTKLSLRDQVHQHVLINLRMLQQVGKFWRFIALLGINIGIIYDIHSSQDCAVDDEPKNMDPAKLNEFCIDARRVTSSILEHNRILRGIAGSVSQSDAEVTNLGVSHMTGRSTFAGEDTLEHLIAEISKPWQATAAISTTGEALSQSLYEFHGVPTQPNLEPLNGWPFPLSWPEDLR